MKYATVFMRGIINIKVYGAKSIKGTAAFGGNPLSAYYGYLLVSSVSPRI